MIYKYNVRLNKIKLKYLILIPPILKPLFYSCCLSNTRTACMLVLSYYIYIYIYIYIYNIKYMKKILNKTLVRGRWRAVLSPFLIHDYRRSKTIIMGNFNVTMIHVIITIIRRYYESDTLIKQIPKMISIS